MRFMMFNILLALILDGYSYVRALDRSSIVLNFFEGFEIFFRGLMYNINYYFFRLFKRNKNNAMNIIEKSDTEAGIYEERKSSNLPYCHTFIDKIRQLYSLDQRNYHIYHFQSELSKIFGSNLMHKLSLIARNKAQEYEHQKNSTKF